MDIIIIFFILLNYFWLSDDPDESASMYCDQHCFKIGSELMESIWDVVLVLSPELSHEFSGGPGISETRRHSRKDCLWHPLSVWNGLCRSNLHRSLINANAIFQEHYNRKGTTHKAWAGCKFLLASYKKIDFNSSRWKRWFMSQCGDETTKYRPLKTKKKDLQARIQWCTVHSSLKGKSILSFDRNTCEMTEPPRCINEKECKDAPDVVSAYRLYYHCKVSSMKQGMRYYYTNPPSWLQRENCSGKPLDFEQKIHVKAKPKSLVVKSKLKKYRKIIFLKK